MKILDLIGRLEAIRELHGNLEVDCSGAQNPDGTLKPNSGALPVENVEARGDTTISVRLLEMHQWQHKGACKVCGEVKLLDGCNYCNECYPYDGACDKYKIRKETHNDICPPCKHNYYAGICSECGAHDNIAIQQGV